MRYTVSWNPKSERNVLALSSYVGGTSIEPVDIEFAVLPDVEGSFRFTVKAHPNDASDSAFVSFMNQPDNDTSRCSIPVVYLDESVDEHMSKRIIELLVRIMLVAECSVERAFMMFILKGTMDSAAPTRMTVTKYTLLNPNHGSLSWGTKKADSEHVERERKPASVSSLSDVVPYVEEWLKGEVKFRLSGGGLGQLDFLNFVLDCWDIKTGALVLPVRLDQSLRATMEQHSGEWSFVQKKVGKRSPKRKAARFPVPDGLSWPDISFRFLSVERVMIIVGKHEREYTMYDLGLADRRKIG